MDSRPVASKLASTSLTLAFLGWIFYLLQACFDLTLGLLLAIISAGSSTICSTVLDLLPFLLWLAALLTGHIALGQIKHSPAPGRRRAVWGLVLGYTGMLSTILFVVIGISLVAAGIHLGILDKLFPALFKH